MVRAASFGFALILGTAIFVSACGRQVTPNPPGLGAGGAPPGYIALFFTVGSTFNFSNYQYMFVLNTTGSGVTPSTDTLQTNWAGYSYALVARGNGITSYAQFVHLIPPNGGKGPPAWLPLQTTPQQFSYNLNSNGTNTEFSMLVQRTIFNPTPGPSPTASPPSKWAFNAFVAAPGASQGRYSFVDSLGAGGPIDPQFISPVLCMDQPFDNPYYGIYTPNDPAAQIVQVEIANNPVHPTACP